MIPGRATPPTCRKPEIMADAAHAVLVRDARGIHGQFLIDDDVLREAGVTDFSQLRGRSFAAAVAGPVPRLIAEAPMRYLHTMVRVRDLDASLRFYCDGLGPARNAAHGERARPVHAGLSCAPTKRPDAEVELTYNWPGEGGAAARITAAPATSAISHSASTTSMRPARTCRRMGVTINRPPRDGHMAFVRSPDLISIELLQQGEAPAAAGAVGVDAEYRQLVGSIRPCSSAWARSAIRSSTCSRPTEIRSRFCGDTGFGPSTDARCSTSDSQPPSDVALVNRRSLPATASAASRPPRSSMLSIAPKSRHLPRGDRMPGVRCAGRVVHPFDRRMCGQEFGHLARIRAMPRHARRQRAAAAQGQPGTERRQHRAGDVATMRDALVEVIGRANTSAPPSTSLCPPKYLVVECITTSAPSASGRCSTGVAKVLSQASSAPCACAMRASAAMSLIFMRGLDGVSAQIIATLPAQAVATASRSAMSTATASMPRSGQEFACQEAQAAVAVVRDQHARAVGQRFQQARHRRHAGGERERRFAAFECGERGLAGDPGSGCPRAGIRSRRRVRRPGRAEGGGEVDRWRECAGFGVGFGAGVDGERGRVQACVGRGHRLFPCKAECLARGVDGGRDFSVAMRARHEAGLEGRRRQVHAALEHRVEEAVEQRRRRRRSPGR